MPRTAPAALLSLALLAPAALADETIRPSQGGQVSAPQAVFESKAALHDTCLVAHGGTLHLFALATMEDGSQNRAIHHRSSADGGKTWSEPRAVALRLEARLASIQAFAHGGKLFLVLATNPDLPPHSYVRLFMGKKYEGQPGWMVVLRLAADGRSVEKSHPMRLENPGSTVFSHRVFRPSVTLLGEGAKVSVLCATSFPFTSNAGATYAVWSVLSVHSADGGDTWQAPQFMRKAFRQLPFFKPFFYQAGGQIRAVFGDRYDKQLAHLGSADGQAWAPVESDLAQHVQWEKLWQSGARNGDEIVMGSMKPGATAEGAVTSRLEEVASTDGGKSWKKVRVLDLGLAEPHATQTLADGKLRAHVVPGKATFVLSADGGKTWVRNAWPAGFEAAPVALIPGRGLAALKAQAAAEGQPAQVRMVVATP